jgi:phosphoribosylglycinamide formyltransferase 1
VSRVLRLAVLVSGEGTTLEGLADAIDGGHLPASIVLVVADRPHAPAIERARRRGIPTVVLPMRGTPGATWADHLDSALHERRAELVLLAGFLSIVPDDWLDRWVGRVINIHPSLLPKYGGRGFYGRHVHEAVLAAGEPETGASVHLVTRSVDAGPVLAQARLPIGASDTPETLRARLRPIELDLLAQTIRRFADGSLPLPYRVGAERPEVRDGRGPTG